MLDILFSRYRPIEKALDAAWLRNEAIAQNIANVDTPGYKRKAVAFEEYLNKALDNKNFRVTKAGSWYSAIDAGTLEDVKIKVYEDNRALSMRLDGNNVDIDSEMALMAKNSIQYNTLIQSLNASFRRLKSVINEGRK